METFPVLLDHCAGNSSVSGEFLPQRPVTRSFDVSFDLCLNKRFSKQSRRWDLRPNHTHFDDTVMQSCEVYWRFSYCWFQTSHSKWPTTWTRYRKTSRRFRCKQLVTNASVTSHSRAPYGLFPGCSRAVLNKNRTSTHGARTGPVRRRTSFASPYGARRVSMHAL